MKLRMKLLSPDNQQENCKEVSERIQSARHQQEENHNKREKVYICRSHSEKPMKSMNLKFKSIL